MTMRRFFAALHLLALGIGLGAVWTLVMVPDGSDLYANERVLEYTGYAQEDVIAGGLRGRVFQPEDVERLREERQQALSRGVPFEVERRARRNDGQYTPLVIAQLRANPWANAGGSQVTWPSWHPILCHARRCSVSG